LGGKKRLNKNFKEGTLLMDENLKELRFSRQFLLGPRTFVLTNHWKATPLEKSLILSTHPKLDFEIETAGSCTLVLLGYIIDPFNPAKTSAEILTDIIEKATDVLTVIDATIHLSGRWVLIYFDSQDSVIFTDPYGLRQVYYHVNNEGFWCGSQPEIIKAATGLDLNKNKNFLEFITSLNYQSTECALVGNKTRYADCYHLLPNHFLNLNTGSSIRFFPQKKPSSVTVDNAIQIASSILKGSMDAISQRFSAMLAVTAGWDTRLLFAATKNVSSRFVYYVDRMGALPPYHPDVQVPQRLFQKLGLNFVVKNSREDPPEWFMKILSQSVSEARLLPKTRMIYGVFSEGLKSIDVNGNGSEVCRNFYDKFSLISGDNPTTAELAGFMGYYKSKFVKNELADWENGLELNGTFGYHILDLLYWEQRMSNWGAHYASEQDVSIEDFKPFNNRLLVITLLSLPREYRSGPRFPIYTKLIEEMWPEALAEPINPTNFFSSYLHLCFDHLPLSIRSRLKLIRFALKDFLKISKGRLKRPVVFLK